MPFIDKFKLGSEITLLFEYESKTKTIRGKISSIDDVGYAHHERRTETIDIEIISDDKTHFIELSYDIDNDVILYLDEKERLWNVVYR